jgi:glyoxylase-like metal-dependent hydrolase (beta-lactamase superfamily II)
MELHLIDLDQQLPGQRRFISCWAGKTDDFSFIVDPGPPSTVEILIDRLEELGFDRLDHVLLTHIHLDHGGATARICERWPAARVHCHKNGRKHLIDPQRLWQGSRQVLGHKAEVYGEPDPVPAEVIAEDPDQLPRGLSVILTPGHAPHHVAFLLEDHLFLGEAAGTFSTLGQGPEALDIYLRPATPPRFLLPVASESIDRLLALDPVPRNLCFAHHGMHAKDSRLILEKARHQLDLWVETIAAWIDREKGGELPLPGSDQEKALGDLIPVLQAADPLFARGARLPEDIRIRESDFTRQTLRGMLGYLQETRG